MKQDRLSSFSDWQNDQDSRIYRVRCNLTGVEVTPLSKAKLLESAISLLARRDFQSIAGHNLHSAYLSNVDPVLKAFYDNASIILPDGKPIEIDARRSIKAVGKELACERIGSTDWLSEFLQQLKEERIAVVGAMPQINADFIHLVKDLCPSCPVVGIHGDEWELRKAKVISEINVFQPSLVIIGLGMPLQEHFLFQNKQLLPNCLYVLVGGALDQMTGAQKLAPRWVGKVGFEWAYRLATQPKRLSNRYLIEPWKLLSLRALKQIQSPSNKSGSHD